MFNHLEDDPDTVVRRFTALAARCDASSQDARPRRSLLRFAVACCGAFPELAEQALVVLARDREFAVRKGAAAGLRMLLARLDGLSRIRLVIAWSMSDKRRLRAAIARALRSRLPILGVVPALDTLAHDQYADVRHAACATSARRVRHGADAFAEILREGAHDARRSVRRVATRALTRMAARNQNGRIGRETR